jgi:hypothetical protein
MLKTFRSHSLALVLAAATGLAMAAGLRAQDAAPVIGSEATAPQGDQLPADQLPIDQQLNDGVRRVLIVGDQLAGGMGAGLTRMTDEDDTVDVVNRFNETSGLTRPEIYDWAAAIPKMAEGKSFNTAIVLIGLNDRRDMRDGDKVLAFNSSAWVALYKSRIDAVIDALQAQNMQVYWMSEPPIGDAARDSDMVALSSYFKERAEAKGATYIDIRTPLLGPDGAYTERGADDTGTDRRLRESDGVTFFKQGNNRLGQIALAALNAGPKPADVPVAVAAPVDAGVGAVGLSAVAVDDDPNPVIGQQGADDTVVAKPVGQVAEAVEGDKAAREAASTSIIGIAAAKGSKAEALFNTGLSGAAPTGRFDDFSLAPKAP